MVHNWVTPFDSSIFERFFYNFDKNRLFCLNIVGSGCGGFKGLGDKVLRKGVLTFFVKR